MSERDGMIEGLAGLLGEIAEMQAGKKNKQLFIHKRFVESRSNETVSGVDEPVNYPL